MPIRTHAVTMMAGETETRVEGIEVGMAIGVGMGTAGRMDTQGGSGITGMEIGRDGVEKLAAMGRRSERRKGREIGRGMKEW